MSDKTKSGNVIQSKIALIEPLILDPNDQVRLSALQVVELLLSHGRIHPTQVLLSFFLSFFLSFSFSKAFAI